MKSIPRNWAGLALLVFVVASARTTLAEGFGHPGGLPTPI